MVSKTKMLELVKSFAWEEAGPALDESPELLDYRDEKGRGLLHLTCSVNLKRNKKRKARDSIKPAGALIERGLDLNEPAFHRGDWLATPLWHAISRGGNHELATFLLEEGCDPNHCLWSAVFNRDAKAIRTLIGHDAEIDPVYEDGTTPFLLAAKGGHWEEASVLLELGANVDFQDPNRRTAFHWSLKNGADAKAFSLLLSHDARGDIEDGEGRTAASILRRKKSPALRKLADRHFPV